MKEEMISVKKMKALELNAEYFGVSRLQLMENAGRAVAEEVSARFDAGKSRVAVFCGLGGNGGDGFVAARHLLTKGFEITVVIAGNPKKISDAAALQNWNALESLRDYLTIHEVSDSSNTPRVKAEVIIDALLGIGLKGKVRPPVLQLIRTINRVKGFRLAVDVPSGIDADTGEILGEAVKANLTVTFHKIKTGMRNAHEYTGEIVVRDIGIPPQVESLAGPGDVVLTKRKRTREAHKGDFGRLLIVGGSEEFSGAPALAAMAALRTGVDLVYVAAPEKTAYSISAMSPNLITIKLEGEQLNPDNVSQIEEHIEKCDAVIIGPGLGTSSETEKAVKTLIKRVNSLKRPVLLDADGLKAYSKAKHPFKAPAVLTPHAGEYRLLTGKTPPKEPNKKALEVQSTAARLNAVILLKGSVDVISDGEHVKLNYTGNPGMTVGGTGDVLSGVVGAFLAQRVDPFEAAVAGAFVNGAAGDFAVDKLGYHIVPTDLLEFIPKVLDNPMSHIEVHKTVGRKR